MKLPNFRQLEGIKPRKNKQEDSHSNKYMGDKSVLSECNVLLKYKVQNRTSKIEHALTS